MTPIGDTTEETFDVASELEQLESLTMAALKRRYRQATGHDSKTRNRQYLIRRLIWIAQAAVHGGLGEDALALAAALANDASIRASPPRARVLGVQAPNADATRDQRKALARAACALPLSVEGDRGFTYAEVTMGGVPLSEVKLDTMESRVCPGLHLAGEILDVDGRIGGFNFQWAWATGFIAGGAAGDSAQIRLNP